MSVNCAKLLECARVRCACSRASLSPPHARADRFRLTFPTNSSPFQPSQKPPQSLVGHRTRMPPMPIIRHPCHRPPNNFLVARRRFLLPAPVESRLPCQSCLASSPTPHGQTDLHIYYSERTFANPLCQDLHTACIRLQSYPRSSLFSSFY